MHQFRAQHEINQRPSPVTTCSTAHQVIEPRQENKRSGLLMQERLPVLKQSAEYRAAMYVYSLMNIWYYFTIVYCLRVTLHNWPADVWCLGLESLHLTLHTPGAACH